MYQAGFQKSKEKKNILFIEKKRFPEIGGKLPFLHRFLLLWILFHSKASVPRHTECLWTKLAICWCALLPS
jgi:hypothetical protein